MSKNDEEKKISNFEKLNNEKLENLNDDVGEIKNVKIENENIKKDLQQRPTSLQLESVLEYTNKIKAFLGLKEEEDDDISRNLSSKSNCDEMPINEEIPNSFEIKDKNDSNKLECGNENDNYNCKLPFDQNSDKSDDEHNSDALSVENGEKQQKIDDKNLTESTETNSLEFPVNSNISDVSAEDKEKLPNEIFPVNIDDVVQIKTDPVIKQEEFENIGNNDTFSNKVEEVETPYQITHIEEGLRQVEKSCQNNNGGAKENTVIDYVITESKNQNNKPKIEDIRRFSAEVVNSVIQSAGDEVKVILKERNSIIADGANELIIDINPIICTPNHPNMNENIETNKEKAFEDSTIFIGHETSPTNLISKMEKCKKNSIRDIDQNSFELDNVNKSITIKSISEIEYDTETYCGIGSFTPEWLQPFATANYYLVLYSIIGILHGSYYTYLVGVLSTLEKRFSFKSKTSGLIMILDEITPLFIGVLIGYIGNRVHRPRLLSFGMFLSAFCCFASALPYFLYGTATHLADTTLHNKTGTELCNADVRLDHCDSDDRPPTLTAILLLMLGSFLKGFGNLAYYAIGLAYLDDNAKKKNTPIYFAIAFSFRLLGPMAGYLMSSAFLKIYENPFDDPGFKSDDPRWIGAWWMGFMLQGILLLIFAGPMAFFPRRLPNQNKNTLTENISYSGNIFEGLFSALKRLAKNPLYVLIVLNTIFIIYGNFGFYIMLPRYMENQFQLSASNASLFAGPPGIAALMVSTIIGGYMIWKFKPSAKFLVGGLITLEIISTVGYLLLMIPKCEKIEMTNFGFGKESLILEDHCNAFCNCSTVSYTPVCGADGKTSYFSPCYAGCTYHSNQSYFDCSCIKDASENAFVTKGICRDENCWSQALIYIVTLPILQFIVNILRVAHTMIMLRSIKPEDKNIGLGVFETVLAVVAFIPFPVLYGALVDSTCLVWEKSCGETGNCWIYDIQKFNYSVHGTSAFFCGLSTVALSAIYFLINRVGDLYEDEDKIVPD